jgi:hypothetical protein
MRRFLRRLLVSFERDDLFLRVVFVLSGVLFGGIGVALLVFVSTHAGVSLFAEVLFWAFAALFTAAGGLMAARCAFAGAIATSSIPGPKPARCCGIGGKRSLDCCHLF